jgi:Glycosyl transferase family 2
MQNTEFLAILCVRNEGAFLIDWLAHHRATGFTGFLVFSNNSQDGTDAMLDRLQAMGWLTHIRNEGPYKNGPQWDALRFADGHPQKQAADWLLPLDIDEFVNVHVGDRTLAALLGAIPDATAIPLTWRLFGNAGVTRFEDRPVPHVFTRAAPRAMTWPWRASLFKTLFRNNGTYGHMGVHRPRKPGPARIGEARWFDGSGTPLPQSYRTGGIFTPLGHDPYRLVQLNHYALGAMDSYVLKCDRGRANRDANAFDLSYWVERNFATDDDNSILGLASRASPIVETLRTDPILGPLHDAAVAWRHARFESLMLNEPFRGLFGRLLMTPPSRPLTPRAARFLTDAARRGTALPRASETEADAD